MLWDVVPVPMQEWKNLFAGAHPRHSRMIKGLWSSLEHAPNRMGIFWNGLVYCKYFWRYGAFQSRTCLLGCTADQQFQLRYNDNRVDEAFLHLLPSRQFAGQVMDRLLRGTDLRLPDETIWVKMAWNAAFRTKFWEDEPNVYQDVVFQPDPLPDWIAESLFPKEIVTGCWCTRVPSLRYSWAYWMSARQDPSSRTLPAWITVQSNTVSW